MKVTKAKLGTLNTTARLHRRQLVAKVLDFISSWGKVSNALE